MCVCVHVCVCACVRACVCVCVCLTLPPPLHPFYLYPQTKHGYLQSNEEEEFLQQVADVLQKTKLEKKKPSPKLQAQDTKPAPPSESDPPETKLIGSSKPSDISGHQEVKPKAAETKGGDAVNHPPIAEQKVLKDESTATSPHVTLNDPISHAKSAVFVTHNNNNMMYINKVHIQHRKWNTHNHTKSAKPD